MRTVSSNVKILLRKQGYSKNAVDAISKWYCCTEVSRRPCIDARSLIPSD